MFIPLDPLSFRCLSQVTKENDIVTNMLTYIPMDPLHAHTERVQSMSLHTNAFRSVAYILSVHFSGLYVEHYTSTVKLPACELLSVLTMSVRP